MKKLLVLLLLAGMVMAFMPAHAAPSTTTGTILVPTVNIPFVDPTAPSGVFSRQERCAFLLGGEATNGLLGWAVPLSGDEGDGFHSYSISTATAGATAWVAFYEDLGTCDGVVTGPPPTLTAPAPQTGSGTVPEFTTMALVVIEGALNADFTLTIDAPAA